MGRSFLFREARPKGDVPGNLGFERERLKGLRLFSSFHKLPPKEIVK
jgi:hypothetical protein